MSSAPLIHVPGQAERPVARESPGRPNGKPHGSYIDGLACQRQTIWLCFKCHSRFNYRAYGYSRKEYSVIGSCDACRDLNYQNRLFVHDSFFVEKGSHVHHGKTHLRD